MTELITHEVCPIIPRSNVLRERHHLTQLCHAYFQTKAEGHQDALSEQINQIIELVYQLLETHKKYLGDRYEESDDLHYLLYCASQGDLFLPNPESPSTAITNVDIVATLIAQSHPALNASLSNQSCASTLKLAVNRRLDHLLQQQRVVGKSDQALMSSTQSEIAALEIMSKMIGVSVHKEGFETVPSLDLIKQVCHRYYSMRNRNDQQRTQTFLPNFIAMAQQYMEHHAQTSSLLTMSARNAHAITFLSSTGSISMEDPDIQLLEVSNVDALVALIVGDNRSLSTVFSESDIIALLTVAIDRRLHHFAESRISWDYQYHFEGDPNRYWEIEAIISLARALSVRITTPEQSA